MTKVPTTDEMDGLYTDEDIANKHFYMAVCVKCTKWTKQDSRERGKIPCPYCGSTNIDNQSSRWYSVRTWNPQKKIQKRDLLAQQGRKTT